MSTIFTRTIRSTTTAAVSGTQRKDERTRAPGTLSLGESARQETQQLFYKKLKNVSCEYDRLNG